MAYKDAIHFRWVTVDPEPGDHKPVLIIRDWFTIAEAEQLLAELPEALKVLRHELDRRV